MATCTYPGTQTFPGPSTFPGCTSSPPPPGPAPGPTTGGAGGGAGTFPYGWFGGPAPALPPLGQLGQLPTVAELQTAAAGAVRGGMLPLVIGGVIIVLVIGAVALANRQVKHAYRSSHGPRHLPVHHPGLHHGRRHRCHSDGRVAGGRGSVPASV